MAEMGFSVGGGMIAACVKSGGPGVLIHLIRVVVLFAAYYGFNFVAAHIAGVDDE